MIEVGKKYIVKPTKRNYLRQDAPTTITVKEVRTREVKDSKKPKQEVYCVVGFFSNNDSFLRYVYNVEEIGNEVK
jgi:hypothetical protein